MGQCEDVSLRFEKSRSQSRGEEIPFSLVRHPTIPPGCFCKPLLGNSLDLPPRMQVCGDSALKGFTIPGWSLEFW